MQNLDTNAFVRFFMVDNQRQTDKVQALINSAGDNAFEILLTVILESEWIFRSYFEMPKAAVIELFRDTLNIRQFKVENSPILRKALGLYDNGKADFADALHAAQAKDKGQEILSFDKDAQTVGMSLIK